MEAGGVIDKKVIISGDQVMLERHYLFIESFQKYFKECKTVSTPNILPRKIHMIREAFNGFPFFDYLQYPKEFDFHKSSWGFKYKSLLLGRKIRTEQPDFVLHIFGMSCPVLKSSPIPYAMTLDYTMALAEKNYPEWALFPTKNERDKWLEKEKEAYQKAKFLFPWSKAVAESLVEDYGIPREKMVVTGSSGNLKPAIGQEKTFGSHKILINASDFKRKGGDVAIAALKIVRERIPTASLLIVGVKEGPKETNVFYVGHVSRKEELIKLFLEADLVIGPALCDPYPGFIIEAMGFGTPCIVSNKDGMPEIVDDGVFIARIVAIKNLLFLLKVLQQVKAQVELTIVGPIEDEQYWEVCKQLIAQLPPQIRVQSVGAKNNDAIPGMLQAHHLFVLPTTGENFGHSIFEAFLAGRPVLISDQTPWRKLEHKQIGWDLPLSNPGAFVAVVETAAGWTQQDFDNYALASWSYAKEYIARSNVKEQYLQLFS